MLSFIVCQHPPPPPFKYFYLPQSFKAPSLLEHIICLPFPPFLVQKSLLPNLLISLVKLVKTSDFSKHVSPYDFMTLCYTGKYHVQATIHELHNSKSSKTKLTNLHNVSDENRNDSKCYQKLIILKV